LVWNNPNFDLAVQTNLPTEWLAPVPLISSGPQFILSDEAHVVSATARDLQRHHDVRDQERVLQKEATDNLGSIGPVRPGTGRFRIALQ